MALTSTADERTQIETIDATLPSYHDDISRWFGGSSRSVSRAGVAPLPPATVGADGGDGSADRGEDAPGARQRHHAVERTETRAAAEDLGHLLNGDRLEILALT
jgi:hypothetical protein